MKKTLLLLSLVLVIAISIISGTLAMYTTTIDNLASGSVVAKEFILLEDGTDTFEYNVKIAPSETVTWQFAVKNNNGSLKSETAMDLLFTVDIGAAESKLAIAPLEIKVYEVTETEGDVQKTLVGSFAGNTTNNGTGSFTFENEFDADVAQSHTYSVEITWPSNDAIDINYAGGNFGTAVAVSVTGTQK